MEGDLYKLGRIFVIHFCLFNMRKIEYTYRVSCPTNVYRRAHPENGRRIDYEYPLEEGRHERIKNVDETVEEERDEEHSSHAQSLGIPPSLLSITGRSPMSHSHGEEDEATAKRHDAHGKVDAQGVPNQKELFVYGASHGGIVRAPAKVSIRRVHTWTSSQTVGLNQEGHRVPKYGRQYDL